MSWLRRLYDTYEVGLQIGCTDQEQLMPISHTQQAAHLNVVINDKGELIRVEILDKSQLVIPATEKSAGRTRGIEAHGLSDKIQYIALDYISKRGTKEHGYEKYLQQLTSWVDFDSKSEKLQAILKYVKKGSLIEDLYHNFILPEAKASFRYIKHKNQISLLNDQFLKEQTPEDILLSFVEFPDIFKLITQKKIVGKLKGKNLLISGENNINESYDIVELDIGSLLVCWSVEIPNTPISATWLDKVLQESWISFDACNATTKGLCLISGENNTILATNFPANIRRPGDQAKLISSNDFSGFTFKGRFTDTKKSIEKYGAQSFGVGLVEVQKAHNSLRWLISRQSFRNDTQVIIAWAVSGSKVPEPMKDSFSLLLNGNLPKEEIQSSHDAQVDHSIDLGQSFSKQLKNYLSGYKAKFKQTDNIIIMGLDSATSGRLAITYYQEIFPQEYIDKISLWHNDFAWYQRRHIEEDTNNKKTIVKTIWPISSPSPREIWEAIYGRNLTDSLKKNTVERILHCIVEAQQFPRDLVLKAVQRACNRSVKRLSDQYSTIRAEKSAWEKDLCIACALFKGYSKREKNKKMEYKMTLETDNFSRDYLYGRLLAVAEKIEEMALYVAGEERSTTAARLMQRFADRPASTWRNIELALQPYIQRLKNNRAGFLYNIQLLMDEIMSKFKEGDFINDKSLSGEFLLAYHTQRLDLRNKTKTLDDKQTEE